MFEHADGYDAIELSFDLAVILQPEFHVVGQTHGRCALLRQSQLFLRQRDTRDVHLCAFGQIEGKTAPAAADVEHLLTRFEQQLGRYMAFFVELRLFQAFFVMSEIGAGILQVFVQEQPIELVGNVVVMRDVPLGSGRRIVLLEEASDLAQAA